MPEAIAWASAAQTNGEILPDGSVTVDVTLDSTAMYVGYHTGTLCVMSNDPSQPEVSVELTMHVIEPVDPTSVSVSSLAGDGTSMLPLWLLATAIAAIAGGVVLRRRQQNSA